MTHGSPPPLMTPFTGTNFYMIPGIHLCKISIRVKHLLLINHEFYLKTFWGLERHRGCEKSQRTWAWPQHPYPELTITFNSNSRESSVLSGLCRHLHAHDITQTAAMHTYSSNKINILLKKTFKTNVGAYVRRIYRLLKRKASVHTNEMYVPTYFYIKKEHLIKPLALLKTHSIFRISQD